jgi:hypothetical protein
MATTVLQRVVVLLGQHEQLRGQHHEPVRELEDDPQSRVDLAALDRADVVAMKPAAKPSVS